MNYKQIRANKKKEIRKYLTTKRHGNTKPHVDKYCELYLMGFSSNEVAKIMNKPEKSVMAALMTRGVLRKGPGKETEEKVAKWLEAKNKKVLRQKGDAPFDLLVNGERIDVKSAHNTIVNKKSRTTHRRYFFNIKHPGSKYSDHKRDIDNFYLVFLDEVSMPIYSLKPKYVNTKTLTISHATKTKYPIKFVGYLHL